jgi:hypothetical protein
MRVELFKTTKLYSAQLDFSQAITQFATWRPLGAFRAPMRQRNIEHDDAMLILSRAGLSPAGFASLL